MSDCLVWRSSVPHRHNQFSHAWSAVTEYKRHLQSKHSTTERHIKTMLLCLTYTLKAAKLIHGDDDIDRARDTSLATIPRSHFMVTPTSVGHVRFTLRLRKN